MVTKKNTTPKESEEQIAFVNYCEANNIIVLSTQNGMYIPKKMMTAQKTSITLVISEGKKLWG